MNETDFIRQQLHLERTHLREILRAARPATLGEKPARPVALYLEWAGQRLTQQLLAHQTALHSAPGLEQALRGPLATAASAARQAQEGGAEALLNALDAWNERLDAAAARALPVAHWRRAVLLNADTILEERQLYAAATSSLARA